MYYCPHYSKKKVSAKVWKEKIKNSIWKFKMCKPKHEMFVCFSPGVFNALSSERKTENKQGISGWARRTLSNTDRTCATGSAKKSQSHGNKNLIVKISELVCRGEKLIQHDLQNPKEKKTWFGQMSLCVFFPRFFWTKIIHGYVVFREKGERL